MPFLHDYRCERLETPVCCFISPYLILEPPPHKNSDSYTKSFA